MRVISEVVVKHRTVHDRTGGNSAIKAKAALGALIRQFRASRTPAIPAESLAHQDSIGVPVVHGETLRNHTNKIRYKIALSDSLRTAFRLAMFSENTRRAKCFREA